ncbi:hypothetical protein DL771_008817 [Monosporascus sp. 5C6A]|nr:hypothetical protein DL771_008817 [Monosporascus sp. 5C6A]
MADPLTVVGIVANIIQLVDFGSRVLNRLEEYQSKFGDLPEAFRHIKAELPVPLDALRQTKAAIDAGSVQDESKNALLPAVEGCGVQINLLGDVIAEVLPSPGDSWARRSRKALRSLRYDTKVEKITSVVRGYIQTLTYHAAASLRPLTDCKSKQPASRVALVGLGGVGKSQLAVEYSYRTRERSPDTWVFWVPASSPARFEEGYRKIAERAKLPGWDQSDVDILKLVYSWLSHDANGRWVMIIDNADDLSVFSPSGKGKAREDNLSTARAPLLEFLPQSSNGSILITSRNRDVAFQLTGSYADIIRIPPMEQAHALALLRIKLGGSVEHDDAVALIEALDYMPLAIAEAAAYISQRAPRATVSRYLQDLRRGDRDGGKLLNMDIEDSPRDGTASNSIIATWQISFEHIRRDRPSAMRLLSLMSLFDRQGIPESLLDGRYQDGSDASFDFEEDLNVLTSFSLVATDVDGHQFEMHRLVQFSTRKWLELQGELEGWREKYVRLMDDNFPMGEYENWKACRALFPHAEAAIPYRPGGGSILEAWASVLHKAARYAAEGVGNYQAAHKMEGGALEAREATLGAEHPDTLKSVSNLGLMLSKQGKYKEAEAMHRRSLEGREEVLGREHPDTLASVNNLGLVLESQGKYEDAEAMHRRALEGREEMLGREHPDTLASVNSLGLVLESQGKYKEAEAMHRRALEGEEEILGREHPDTLFTVYNLGLVLEMQGKYEDAEAMHRRALEGIEKVLGREHPDTLSSVNSLGSVLESQGKYEEAEAMYRRALEGMEKALGREHPDTFVTVSNLGYVLDRQGKYEEAEAMHRQTLEGKEKVLGREHLGTLITADNLGSVLEKQGKYEEAEAMHRRALEGMEKALGREHPDTFVTINNLGYVLDQQGKYEEAEAMYRRALEGEEKVLGREHPGTLITVDNLGSVLEKQGKYKEAEAMHRQVLEGREKVLGPEHPDTLTSVNNLGWVLERQGKY